MKDIDWKYLIGYWRSYEGEAMKVGLTVQPDQQYSITFDFITHTQGEITSEYDSESPNTVQLPWKAMAP